MEHLSLKKLISLILILMLAFSFTACTNSDSDNENGTDGKDESAATLPDGSSVYKNVFVAALGDKYERLTTIRAPKIAVVGGSSVAFGLDSRMLGLHTEREVVNFGLFATLGSKIMLDLSEDGLRGGDIVVFTPELDNTTMSLYFGARAAWQAIDASPALYDSVYAKNATALDAEKASYEAERAEYIADGAPDPSGVYNRKNFNTYGDINYHRPYNTMALGYDPNTVFELNESIVSKDFLDYFNSYCDRMRAKGVTVYFSFCPINNMALSEATDAAAIEAFEKYLEDNLNCPVISKLSDYIMDWGYFYDTNLHLNDAGVTARTQMLVNDLRYAMGIGSDIAFTVPEAPGLEGTVKVDGNNIHSSLFTYDYSKHGDTILGATITGLTEEGKAFLEEEVIIPATFEDYPVIIVSANVLSGFKNLKKVTLGENIKSLPDGVFAGCAGLTEIHADFSSDCLVSIPGDATAKGVMDGAPDGCLIYCKEEYRNDFLNHYTWQHYYKYFAK